MGQYVSSFPDIVSVSDMLVSWIWNWPLSKSETQEEMSFCNVNVNTGMAWFVRWRRKRYIRHSLIISREVLILTLSILPAMQGCISWYIPWYGLMMREWPYTASSRDILDRTSPPTSKFPLALEMSLGFRPRDISRASGNLEVGGDVQPNTSRLEAVYVHSLIINPYQGMYQEIHPCRAGSIGIVKINTSQMMGECSIFTWLTCCFHKTINKCQNLTYHTQEREQVWHRRTNEVKSK